MEIVCPLLVRVDEQEKEKQKKARILEKQLRNLEKHFPDKFACYQLQQSPITCEVDGVEREYRIETDILEDAYTGEGKMGHFLTAVDESGHRVAIKVSKYSQSDEKYEDRLHREFELLSNFDQEGIVRVLKQEEIPVNDMHGAPFDLPYMVMEYLPGKFPNPFDPLLDLSKGRIKRALKVGLDLCSILEELHRSEVINPELPPNADSKFKRPVVHRDLSPNNLAYDSEGRLTLIDFGCAKYGGEHCYSNYYSATPEFMAPEVTSDERATIKSDVYSLGKLIQWCVGNAKTEDSQLADIAEAVDRVIITHALDQDPEKRSLTYLRQGLERVRQVYFQEESIQEGPKKKRLAEYVKEGMTKLAKTAAAISL